MFTAEGQAAGLQLLAVPRICCSKHVGSVLDLQNSLPTTSSQIVWSPDDIVGHGCSG